MINSMILKLNEKAQANIEDNSEDNKHGAAKAFGYGLLLGCVEGCVLVGATYIAVQGTKLLINLVKK